MKFSQMIADAPPVRVIPIPPGMDPTVLMAQDFMEGDEIVPGMPAAGQDLPDSDEADGDMALVVNYTEATRLLYEVDNVLQDCLAAARMGKTVRGKAYKALEEATTQVTQFIEYITSEEEMGG